MHLYSENLALEVAQYYRNIVLGHGATPKVFTLVNGDGDQYLFFIDDLQISFWPTLFKSMTLLAMLAGPWSLWIKHSNLLNLRWSIKTMLKLSFARLS